MFRIRKSEFHFWFSFRELEFFAYAEDWVSRAKIKGAKNYLTMLNTLEKFLECRKLFFQ